MASLRRFALRLSNVFRPGLGEPDLARELDAHLTLLADEFQRRGLSRAEAQLAARRALGGVERAKDLQRDARSFAWLDDVRRDVRYALRTLRRTPGFTAVAVLMLALGIGINATAFIVSNAVLFKGFPSVERNDRIVYIAGRTSCCVSYPDFQDWRAQAKSFESLAVVHGVGIVYSDGSGFPERYDATEVSAETFRLAGQRPIIGRDFSPSDETPGAAPVAILSYGFWERRHGKDQAVIGRTVRINGAPTTVIGIMPQGFSFPQKQDLWVPLVPTPTVQRREARDLWFAFGRLAEGVTIETARVEMDAIGRRLASAYPQTNQDFLPVIRGFREFFIGPNESLVYGSMWGAVGCVLLIACANLANLMLARTIGRSREMSIRIAFGAGRWRIIRQLLIESVMLSGLGGFIGWWIARWGVRAVELAERGPGLWPWRVLDHTMDYRVLAYITVISIGTGVLFALAPASRLSQLDTNAALKDGGRGATGGGRAKHLSGLLVIGEMALAVVLLAAAGLMIRSLMNVSTADPGANTANVLTALVELPDAKYPRAEAQLSFYERLKTRLAAIPGVESVSIASQLPTWGTRRLPYELAGAPPAYGINDEQRRPTISALVVDTAYFQTLGAGILSGREFNDSDGLSGVPVVIVNERFASQHWPGEDPLGKRVRLFNSKTPEAWLTIVGVAPNIVQNDATRQAVDPLVYLPYRQRPSRGMWVIARTRVPPGSLGAALRRAVQTIDADLPIWLGPFTLTERLAEVYWNRKLYGLLFLIFAATALLLASMGVYAVIAHSVSQQTQEIGIRMAMGATARDILELVFRQGMLPLGIGLTMGLAASFAVNRVLKTMLVQVSPADPITLVVASATLIVAASLGCLIPAHRAMRVDPVIALRHD
jgi:putative ABC transport system permease protein